MNPNIIIPTCKNELEIAPQVCDVEGFSLDCRLIVTCKKASASINRNIGLEQADSDIVVMIDDDISGFYMGWWKDLIEPLKDKNVVMTSANLVNTDGSPAPMMFRSNSVGGLMSVPRVPTACVAFRKSKLRFDENFIGSGFEDDDFCAQLKLDNPSGRFVVVEDCRIVHANEMKNQHGENFEKNKAYFNSKWKTDRSTVGYQSEQILFFYTFWKY